MEFNIIGTGRLGFSIAYALQYNKIASLNGVYNRSSSRSQQIIAQLGHGSVITTLANLPDADLTFITSPDNYIQHIAETLAQSGHVKTGSVIVHCSGVLGAQEGLGVLQSQGCLVASFHPLKAFSESTINPYCFNGCTCAIEGDKSATALLKSLFQPLGAALIEVNPANTALYHAGAVIASNYLVTLAASASECLIKAGVSETLAPRVIIDLMQSSLDNLKNKESFSAALTGPLMRGDTDTITRHLQALKDPILRKLYQSAGLATLPLTSVDEQTREILSKLFSD